MNYTCPVNIPLGDYAQLLGKYLRPLRGRVALLVLLIFAGIAFDLANPQIVRRFIDAVSAGNATPQNLYALAGLFVLFAVLKQIMAVSATSVSETVGWMATNALRADLALHLLKLDRPFHTRTSPGILVERVDGDVTALANFFSQLVIRVLGNALLLLGVMAALFAEDWRVGIGLSAFAVIALVILIRLRKIAAPHWLRLRAKAAEFAGFVGERLAGTEDIRGNGAVGYTLGQFDTILREWLPLQARANFAGYSMWMASIATFAVGTAVAFGIGAALYQQGVITLGGVYLIFSYTELIRRPIEQIRQQIEELQRASASIARVKGLLDAKPQLSQTSQILQTSQVSETCEVLDSSVVFDRVSFAYDADEPVLSEVSFSLPAGKVLGLLGRTGSGKTTTARLLLRIHDTSAGEIRVGGAPIRQMPLEKLRQTVSMVTQEVQLFHASVRDNLTFFDRAIPDARIEREMIDLGLGAWLARMPRGLDTELQSGGAGLSAGESQLLAFGRLFLRDPRVVILDEASSRLDPVTEALIERAVDRLLAGRTGIIIAHRLATIHRADYIMILEDGQIAEFGERVALAQDPASRFSHLLRTGLEEALV